VLLTQAKEGPDGGSFAVLFDRATGGYRGTWVPRGFDYSALAVVRSGDGRPRLYVAGVNGVVFAQYRQEDEPQLNGFDWTRNPSTGVLVPLRVQLIVRTPPLGHQRLNEADLDEVTIVNGEYGTPEYQPDWTHDPATPVPSRFLVWAEGSLRALHSAPAKPVYTYGRISEQRATLSLPRRGRWFQVEVMSDEADTTARRNVVRSVGVELVGVEKPERRP
jgi:hypothetical protein